MSFGSFRFRRGETIALPLDAVRGDPGMVTEIRAELRKMQPGGGVDHAGAPAAVFEVETRAASPGSFAGWTFTLDADVSGGLAIGKYRADARLAIDDDVSFSEQVEIVISEPVTVA